MKQFFKFLFASILGFFISAALVLVFFISIIAVVVTSGNKEVNVKNNSILVFNLDQIVLERPNNSIANKLGFLRGKTTEVLNLRALLSAIKKAKTDANIKGIYLKGSYLNTPGLATFEEIHDALKDFKTSKKFVISYAESYNLMGFYLASTANQVYLNPIGNIDFKGLHTSVMFFKDALDKLGIEAQIIRVGKYKSAVEPFMLNGMSAANREQVSVFLNNIHQNILTNIAENRQIPLENLNNISNQMLVKQSEDALQFKMINGTKYEDEVLDVLRNMLKIDKKDDPNTVSINDYSKTIENKEHNSDANKIALIYVNGEITKGNSTEGSSGNVTEALRKARTDEDVKAVVLRVNSPGGDAEASDIIWREVSLMKAAKKPIYVSMGDYAASGGYYVSCNADRIFAEPNTITGSIGVFGIIPNTQKLLNNKLGVHVDVVKTGEFSDLGAIYKPLSVSEKNIMQNYVNEFYNKFIHKVAQGRNQTDTAIDSIASGRVWEGKDALKIGLVDQIGSLDQTIKAVAEKAKLKNYNTVEFQETPGIVETFLKEWSNSLEMNTLKNELGELFPYYLQFKNIHKHKGVIARMPFEAQIMY